MLSAQVENITLVHDRVRQISKGTSRRPAPQSISAASQPQASLLAQAAPSSRTEMSSTHRQPLLHSTRSASYRRCAAKTNPLSNACTFGCASLELPPLSLLSNRTVVSPCTIVNTIASGHGRTAELGYGLCSHSHGDVGTVYLNSLSCGCDPALARVVFLQRYKLSLVWFRVTG